MDRADGYTQLLKHTVEELSDFSGIEELFHRDPKGAPLPSPEALEELTALSRDLLFPGYFGQSPVGESSVKYHIGIKAERFHSLLAEQVEAGLRFDPCSNADECRKRAESIAGTVLSQMPRIRRTLASDVEAAYLGDPAAHSRAEVICCYPAIRALTCYRIAHELERLRVPLIPRIIAEIAHSQTGIDIHPAAEIGNHFTIDHGTGVVIGATCVIGKNVKLYQGVTLGAKSFPLDDKGNPVKGIPRHPIIGDNVVIYSNATLLGRITVGEGAVIGANVWLTRDVEPGERVTPQRRMA